MKLLKNNFKSLETMNSLEKFIQQGYQEKPLTPEQSKENIKKGMLEIIKNGKHSSNGLLITEDGYFLTPKHCLMKIDDNTLVKDLDGCTYRLEEVCALSKDEDIALAKVKICKEPKPMDYNIYDLEKLKKDIPAFLLYNNASLLYYNREGEISENEGYIYKTSNIFTVTLSNGKRELYPDQFISIIQSGPGDSGGMIINEKGGIIGMLSGGDPMHPLSFCVKFFKALELIQFYKEKLIEKSN